MFRDADVPGEGQVQLPKSGTRDIAAIHGAQRAQSRKRERRRIQPARRRGMGTERVRQHLKRPLVGGAAQLTVRRHHTYGEPRRRLRAVNAGSLPSGHYLAQRAIGELRRFADQREIEDLPPVAREESPADLLGYAVAAVLVPVRGDDQTLCRAAVAVAHRRVADAVRPRVVGARAHTPAQPLLQTQNQALITGGTPIIELVHVGDKAGAWILVHRKEAACVGVVYAVAHW